MYVSNMYNLFTSVHIILFASYVRKYIGWYCGVVYVWCKFIMVFMCSVL